MNRLLFIATAGLANFLSVAPAFGQGCIVARSSEQISGPENDGGYMNPGEFNVAFGYRHLFSFRHFVGPVEQTYRIQQGTQVMNKINLLNFNITYQLTNRFSVSADVPLLLASRRSHNSPYTTTAQGIGDSILTFQGWVFNPRNEKSHGNVSFGVGVMLPSGKDNVTNVVDSFNGKGPQTVLVDYSIQPGTGGYGMVFQWQGFLNVPGKSQAYFNGSYIATPQNYNSVLRSATALNNPNTAYNSISDQYLMEAGISHPIRRIRGLNVSFGPHMEGVPAHDLIGKSLGFRRPGFAISLAPGVSYARGKNLLTASVGRAIYRDRTRSEPDIISGGHGDAAFADYVWLAGYSFRFGGGH